MPGAITDMQRRTNAFGRIIRLAVRLVRSIRGTFITYVILPLRIRDYHRQIDHALSPETKGRVAPSGCAPIGNTIWVFWYQGMEQAPPLVRKCIDVISAADGFNVVIMDKDNLEEHFSFEGNIRSLFQSGKITVQTLSDIIRLQLISRHGGIWMDATLLVMDRNLLSQIRTMPYFSIRHSRADFINKSKWSTFCMAGGKDNPFFSLAYDIFLEWYETHDGILDYFMIDYILLYIYRNYPWAAEMVDSMKPVVRDAYWINRNWYEKFDEAKWAKMVRENSFQKLNWRDKDSPLPESSVGYHFLHNMNIDLNTGE